MITSIAKGHDTLRISEPRSLEPDEYRKELILNVILGFCMAIISLFFFMVLGNALHGKSYIGISHFLIIASPIAIAYRMSRTGRIRTASSFILFLCRPAVRGICLGSDIAHRASRHSIQHMRQPSSWRQGGILIRDRGSMRHARDTGASRIRRAQNEYINKTLTDYADIIEY